MAVDRQGVAWVLSDEGLLFRVSTTDGSCSPTDFAPGQSTFLRNSEWASSPTSRGADPRRSTYGGDGTFGRIDLSSFRVSLVGNWRLGASELSGTADTRIFAFTRGETTSFSEIDPHSGVVLSRRWWADQIDRSYAIASSGGDFLAVRRRARLQVRAAYEERSSPTIDLGVSVVGAGSSTCAAVD